MSSDEEVVVGVGSSLVLPQKTMLRAAEKAIAEVEKTLKEVMRANPVGAQPVRFMITVKVELEGGTEIVCSPCGSIHRRDAGEG